VGQVPGIDLAGITAWFGANLPGARPPLEVRQIAGGRSNLTYRVTDTGGNAWVLRRPPLHGVLPSAHDMGREHRVISALAATPVPVPATFGRCEDPAVTGAPFYVMEYVEGIVPRDEATVAAHLDEPARAAAADSLVDALVALHAVDPDEVGLGELGRRTGYLERQLARWRRQLSQSRTRPLPALDEVHRRLAANLPAQAGPARIVHGDFRLDNVVLSPTGRVLAVLDWELCTLGDPLADVGLLLVYWAEPGDQTLPLGAAPTVMPGFPGRAAVAGAYAARSGRDLADLDTYVAFASWKLAVILEGVVARHAGGAYGTGDDSWRGFAAVVEALADRALEPTGRLPPGRPGAAPGAGGA
jgi:aminoglycoside phosphotransferase (APT) family kinase protein